VNHYSGRLHARELLVCYADPLVGRPAEAPVLKVLPRTDGTFVVVRVGAPNGRGTEAVEATKAEAIVTLGRMADAEGLGP
jgi:hypothetical protein